MKPFIIIVFSISFFSIVAMVSLNLAQQPSGTTENCVEQIKHLQTERVEVLTNLVKLMFFQYERGMIDCQQIIIAETELINVQLELIDKIEDRISFLKSQLHLLESMLKVAETNFKIGTGSETEVYWLKSICLKTQINVLKERQKLNISTDSK